jgi:predicted amidophosphoribosyltransferase
VRHTAPQASLDHEERWRNVKGAFDVAPSAAITGQRVALIDDVMTTGATLDAAARALKLAGAARVEAWVVARADRRDAVLTQAEAADV